MKVAIYCRVSTTNQELEQQLAACKRFCEYRQFEIAATYQEKISSTKARPEYLRLVADLRAMKYEGVVVFRLDRLGRNSRELALLIDELESKGIRVFSINESFDTSTAIGRAMREFIFVLAQLEREQISEATIQRLRALKNLGKKLGRKPRITPELEITIKELRKRGLSLRKIGEQVRVSRTTVMRVCRVSQIRGVENE